MSSWFAWLVIILCVVMFMKVSQKLLKVVICVGLIHGHGLEGAEGDLTGVAHAEAQFHEVDVFAEAAHELLVEDVPSCSCRPEVSPAVVLSEL